MSECVLFCFCTRSAIIRACLNVWQWELVPGRGFYYTHSGAHYPMGSCPISIKTRKLLDYEKGEKLSRVRPWSGVFEWINLETKRSPGNKNTSDSISSTFSNPENRKVSRCVAACCSTPTPIPSFLFKISLCLNKIKFAQLWRLEKYWWQVSCQHQQVQRGATLILGGHKCSVCVWLGPSLIPSLFTYDNFVR